MAQKYSKMKPIIMMMKKVINNMELKQRCVYLFLILLLLIISKNEYNYE